MQIALARAVLEIRKISKPYLQTCYNRCSSLKDVVKYTSFGYIAPGLLAGSKPAQPSIPSFVFGTKNLSGSNSFGLSQK